ncbi:hypothetical protein Tco_0325073 [Tanacetum coccineum]
MLHEVAKKQKMEDDKEKKILNNALRLSKRMKWMAIMEILRAHEEPRTYLLFSQLLKEFDREDLENLWKLVKAKHGNTRPEEGYERVLWGDLKTMNFHHADDHRSLTCALSDDTELCWD